MKFQNPYHLFDIQVNSPEELTSGLLKRIRKKVLAEFELSESPLANFKGHPLDRSSALRLVESLEDPQNCHNFFYLGKYPGLVRFLESGSLKDLRLLPPAVGVDPEFKKFVSRQMAPVIDAALMQHVKKTRWAAAKDVLKRLEWIESRDMDLVLLGSNRHYKRGIRELEQITEGEEDQLKKTDLSQLYDAGMIDFLNHFPEEFQHLRNQYGKALRLYAIALDETAGRPDLGYKAISRASELETDLTISERIRRTRVNLYSRKNEKRKTEKKTTTTKSTSSKQPSSSKDGQTKRRVWRIVAWTFAVVVAIAVGFGIKTENQRDRETRELIESLTNLDLQEDFKKDFQEDLLADLNPTADSVKLEKIKVDLPDFSRLFYVLRDTLLEGLQNPQLSEAEEERPRTGYQPYKDFENAEMGEPIQAEAVFSNQSRHDVVVMLEQMTLKKIARHAYVRSGESYTFKNMPMGFYSVVWHMGDHWKADAVAIEEKRYPGFTEVLVSQEAGSPAPVNQMVYISPVLLFEDDAKWRDKYMIRFEGDTLSQEKITKY